MNELVLRNMLAPANAFATAGSALGQSTLPIIKLSKAGQWVSGAENTPVIETRFAADVQGAQVGFICFVAGDVIDEAMVPVALGQKLSLQDLPEHGPYEGGDGWQPTAALQLRAIESGEEYIFKPTSQGGRAAIGDLLKRYGNRLSTGKGGIPIVELSVSSYEHRRYGRVFKPSFRVAEWRDEAALVNGNAAKLVEEPPNDETPF